MYSPHDYKWHVETFKELDVSGSGNSPLVEFVYDRVFRTTLDKPGFALITLASELHGIGLRKAMEMMVRELSRIEGDDMLAIQSAQRFNQQITTRFHLDNGPDESYLLLGYERSQVRSELSIADYSHAAFDLGISPSEYLDRHNPMFGANAERLAPYITRLEDFNSDFAQLLIVNNSRLPFYVSGRNRLGVLHQATIHTPISGAQRVINSVQIAPASLASEKVPPAEWDLFLRTDTIHGR